jgi:hypothetical protein
MQGKSNRITQRFIKLEDSQDKTVHLAGVEDRRGRKQSASKALDEAESRLKHIKGDHGYRGEWYTENGNKKNFLLKNTTQHIGGGFRTI